MRARVVRIMFVWGALCLDEDIVKCSEVLLYCDKTCFRMRGSVGGVCVRRLIIAGCLCFASVCVIMVVCLCAGTMVCVWAVKHTGVY